jgi:hypothetical protein
MKYFLFIRALAFCSAAVVLIFTSACHKDAPVPDATTVLLASHSWRLLTFTDTDNTYTPPRTTFHIYSAYRLDDNYQFNADNGLVFNDGPLKANPTDAQVSTGTWQFQTNQGNQPGLVITLRRAVTLGTTGITSTTAYDLVKLSADTLRLRTGSRDQTVVVTLVR